MLTLSYIAVVFWASALLNIILNLLLLGRLRRKEMDHFPFVSVIVPARNEERAIERMLRALLAQEYPEFEVIVVDDRSTDSTGSIVDRIASEDGRLVAIHGAETPAGWLGKPFALHQGSERARGEMLLFVDADVHYAPQTLRTAVEHIEATGRAMVALLPHFECRSLWEHALMPALPMAPFSFPLWINEFVPLTYLAIGAGTGNLIRRSAYDATGGHESLRDAVVDDVGLAHHMRRSGFSTGIARTERLVSVRMYHGFREIVSGFTKNAFPSLGRSYVLAVIGLAIMLIAHIGPYVFAIAGVRAALIALALLYLGRLIFHAAQRYSIAAVLLHPLTAIGWIWIIARSTWIVGIRRELHWRGRTYDPSRTRFGAER